jgi:hypothetical protein
VGDLHGDAGPATDGAAGVDGGMLSVDATNVVVADQAPVLPVLSTARIWMS